MEESFKLEDQIRRAEKFHEQENETLQRHLKRNRIIKRAKRDTNAQIQIRIK